MCSMRIRSTRGSQCGHRLVIAVTLIAGRCTRLKWLSAKANKLDHIPDAMSGLLALRGLALDDNRIAIVPEALLAACTELHTLSLRGNPITMEQLRDVAGFSAFDKRRRGKLDKALDARVGVDFRESADYQTFRRH